MKALLMRISILAFFMSLNGLLWANASSGQDLTKIRITLDLKNVTLKTALRKVEMATHLPFSYKTGDVAEYTNINYAAADKSVDKVLSELLTGTGLQYEMVNGNIIFKKSKSLSPSSESNASIANETGTLADGGIKGKVTNQKGEPLANASIMVLGINKGVAAGDDGQFSITGLKPGRYKLQITAIGYGSDIRLVTVTENGLATANFILSDEKSNMTEVTVTALGIRKEKRSLGYSAQEVKGDALTASHQPNIVNALQGQASGLQINSGGGAPGQGAKIILRGINSLDPSRDFQPLFIIDGIPIDNTTDVSDGATAGDETTGSGLMGMGNRASDINPDDIESVNVLKGGAATALYGLRAANGAIVITTKSGKTGKLRISFNSTASRDQIDKYPKTQDKFTQGFMGVYDPTSFWPAFGPTIAETKLIDPKQPDHITNNYKDGFKTGSSYRNSLNISGGTEKAIFTGSFSQFNQTGIMPFTDYKNYSVKAGGEFTFSPKVKMGTSLNYIKSGGRHGNADRYSENLTYWAPRYDLWDYTMPNGAMKVYGPDNYAPIYLLEKKKYVDDVDRIVSNTHFTYSPVKWLDINYRFGVDLYNDARTQTTPGPLGVPDELYPADDFGYGTISEYRAKNTVLNSTFMLNFKNNVGKHLTSSFKIGHDLFNTRRTTVYTRGDTLVVPSFYNLNNAKRVTGNNNQRDYRIIGLFADWTLSWDNFLYLTVTGRNDWTSTLPKENRSFFYPSASLSWVFSENMQLPYWASFGKLRFSVAKIGKDAVPYATSSGYVIGAPYTNGVLPFSLSTQSGDLHLRPEFTTSYEAGAELKFLKNRVGLDFSYYNNTSKDLIIPVAVGVGTGLDRVYLNSGTIRNSGIEISLSGTPIQTPTFGWDIKVNYTRNQNKVISIYPGLKENAMGSQYGYLSSTVTQKYVPGYPVGALFGRTFQRYFGSDHEDPAILDKSRPMVIGANGFPVLNPASKQQYIANSQPKWIGSFSSTFRYKGFSLFLLFDAQQGVYRYNQLANFMASFALQKGAEDAHDTKVFKGVLADGTPNTKAVWLGQGVGPDGINYSSGYYRTNYRGGSENFIENASWIRLRTTSLGYTLPSNWLTPSNFLTGATVTLSANNLFINTKWTGYDPESSSTSSGNVSDGFSGFTYPATRSFILSVNLNF